MAFIPYAPLAAGDHAGRDSGSPELERIAKQHSMKPGQAALAWLLARSPAMLPIPGTGLARTPRGKRRGGGNFARLNP